MLLLSSRTGNTSSLSAWLPRKKRISEIPKRRSSSRARHRHRHRRCNFSVAELKSDWHVRFRERDFRRKSRKSAFFVATRKLRARGNNALSKIDSKSVRKIFRKFNGRSTSPPPPPPLFPQKGVKPPLSLLKREVWKKMCSAENNISWGLKSIKIDQVFSFAFAKRENKSERVCVNVFLCVCVWVCECVREREK